MGGTFDPNNHDEALVLDFVEDPAEDPERKPVM